MSVGHRKWAISLETPITTGGLKPLSEKQNHVYEKHIKPLFRNLVICEWYSEEIYKAKANHKIDS